MYHVTFASLKHADMRFLFTHAIVIKRFKIQKTNKHRELNAFLQEEPLAEFAVI